MCKIKYNITNIKWASGDAGLPDQTVMTVKNISKLSDAFESRYGELPESYNLEYKETVTE